jgi:hypothetical protein
MAGYVEPDRAVKRAVARSQVTSPIHSLELGEPLVGGADLGDGSRPAAVVRGRSTGPCKHVARTAVRSGRSLTSHLTNPGSRESLWNRALRMACVQNERRYRQCRQVPRSGRSVSVRRRIDAWKEEAQGPSVKDDTYEVRPVQAWGVSALPHVTSSWFRQGRHLRRYGYTTRSPTRSPASISVRLC